MGFSQKEIVLQKEAGKMVFGGLGVQKITLFFALLSWMALVALGLAEQSIWHNQFLQLKNPTLVKGLLLNVFIFNTYIYSWQQTRQQKGGDFYSLLWKVFATGGICTIFSAGLTGMLLWLSWPNSFQIVLHTIFFHIELALLLFFLIVAFSKWKRIILYEKNKFVWNSWLVFEIGMFISSITHFFAVGEPNLYFFTAYGVFMLFALVLSINLRWVPYLNYRQKLMSIPMLLGLLACLGYFFKSILSYFANEPLVVDDISKSIFIAVLFSFVAIYTIASLLVIIFNLPTVSVFDSKFKEIAEFQRINDSLIGKSEKEIYEVLLNNIAEVVRTDAAWLESSNAKVFICKDMSKETALYYKNLLQSKGIGNSPKAYSNNYFIAKGHKVDYNSILAVPIKSGEAHLGTVFLLKKMRGAFDNMMVTIVNTFVAQASIAIHNYKTLKSTPNADKSMLIAQKVHQRLLPTNGDQISDFDFYAYSEAAEAVGGDYYDFHQVADGKYAVIIADVAGKGITAAFTMAQVKGIFKSLVQVADSPHEFMRYANVALSDCLEKNVFVTASYFLIDTNESKIYFSRAGHCPSLYYNSRKDAVEYFQNQGLGLGIITDNKFERFINVTDFFYNPRDVLMLYSDGIVEASHLQTGEEYGYERLKAFLEANHDESLQQIGENLLKDINAFTGEGGLTDDHTFVLMRFQ
ncbi:MAG: SpoIIE family protein phosphatase [Flammeovirgaceae bacterium]